MSLKIFELHMDNLEVKLRVRKKMKMKKARSIWNISQRYEVLYRKCNRIYAYANMMIYLYIIHAIIFYIHICTIYFSH